jgi:multiple antibiotic resistance protein
VPDDGEADRRIHRVADDGVVAACAAGATNWQRLRDNARSSTAKGLTMSYEGMATQFITLFVVLDPAATIPMYLLTVRGLTQTQGRLIALYSAGIAFLVLLFFVACFELLLDAMHIPLPSFKLAGSLVLLIYGLHLVFDKIKVDDSLDVNTPEGLVARSVYPLTIPGLAGPGTMMTVVLLTENHHNEVIDQAYTVGLLALCLALIILLFMVAGRISRFLGQGGLNIISRVMGLILSSIAITNGIDSIKAVFNLSA